MFQVNRQNIYLDSGTSWGSACWANTSCLDDASSPLGKSVLLFGCDVGWFEETAGGLWGNFTPALWIQQWKQLIAGNNE